MRETAAVGVRRCFVLAGTIGLAVAATACGRAGEAEINQALGITPTATASAAQVATGTAAAAAAASAQAAAAASGPEGGGAVALGDVRRGSRQFTTLCAGCHRVGGSGPELLAVGGAGAAVEVGTLMPMIREGTGHPAPPGPYQPAQLSDAAVADLAAFIRSRAAP